MASATLHPSPERQEIMEMTVAEIKEELRAREVPFEAKARKQELLKLLAESQDEVHEEETKLLELPSTVVSSRYEDEQILIEQGYEMVSENLDKSKTFLIQELQKLGIPTSYISKMLGAHYSFVHTVVSAAGLEVVEKRTKSDEMREMFKAGLKVSEVSKLMGAHYSYVHGVYKRWNDAGRK